MPRARLRLQSNEGLVALSRAHPEVAFDVLGAWPDEARLRALVETADLGAAALAETVEATDSLGNLDVRHDGPEVVRFEVDTPRPSAHGAMADSGVVPPFPLHLEGGWLSGELVTSRGQLAAFRDELEAADIPYEVTLIESEREPSASLLTDRQREVVDAALAAGYYDVPRTCTLTDLASDLGVDKSVASRILRRAEGRVMQERFESNQSTGNSPGVGR